MSHRHTILPPSSHPATANPLSASSTTQTSALQARIAEKRTELASLRQLRDLSAGLAGQMQQLEEKLSTLSDGTQAVAEVMKNWNGVLRAVYMASAGVAGKTGGESKEGEDGEVKEGVKKEGVDLPGTLVRIPVEEEGKAEAGV